MLTRNKSLVLYGVMLLLPLLILTAATPVLFISHRGESLNAPENTMAAFRAAIERGADGFELDVYLTKDERLICLHDKTTLRTTGVELKPSEATLEELRALDAGSWLAPQFKGEPLPTLEEALSLARDDFIIYVEIKSGVEIMPALVTAIKNAPQVTPERVLFICFNQEVISALREQLPAYRANWLTSFKVDKEKGELVPSATRIVEVLQKTGAHGVGTLAHRQLDRTFVTTIKEAGFGFHVWTVDDALWADKLVSMGTDTVTSNTGAQLKKLLTQTPVATPLAHWLLHENGRNRVAASTLADLQVHGRSLFEAPKGFHLDGTTFLSVPYQLPEMGTLALWFKPASFYEFNTIFDNDLHADKWEMWINAEGMLKMRVDHGLGELSCQLQEPDIWYHIALVWDHLLSKRITLFVNGVAQAEAPLAPRWCAPGGTFFVGGGHPGNTKGRGFVQDLRVYPLPCSATSVQHIYSSHTPQ